MAKTASQFLRKLAYSIVARKDYIDSNPTVILAATKAIARSLKHIQENPDDAKETLRKAIYADLDPAIYEQAWQNNLPTFAKTPTMDKRAVELNFQFKEVVTGKKVTVTFDNVATNRFAEQVR